MGGGASGSKNNAVVSANLAKTNNYVLRLRYPASTNQSRAEQAVTLADYSREVWWKCFVWFPDGTESASEANINSAEFTLRPDHPQHNKILLKLWDTAYSCLDGEQGARLGPYLDATVSWTGIPEQGRIHCFGNGCVDGAFTSPLPHWSFSPYTYGKGVIESDQGQWTEFIGHYKYCSDETAADGISELWKIPAGGVKTLMYSITVGDWNANNSSRGFHTGYLFGSFETGFDAQTDILIDSLTVATRESDL